MDVKLIRLDGIYLTAKSFIETAISQLKMELRNHSQLIPYEKHTTSSIPTSSIELWAGDY